MIEVLEPGLETSVQDFPGRLGYWEQGFPPSGPFDMWSHRLANVLVGNGQDAATLECQFLGPRLKFQRDSVIAVTGADMAPRLDGMALPLWECVAVRAGQELRFGAAQVGARAYIAIAGGIDTPRVLGSRSTFHMAGVGGIEGHALKAGQVIPVGGSDGAPVGARVRDDRRPAIDGAREWTIEVVAGPNDDWIDAAAHAMFLSSPWTLSAKSNRTGLRLSGPEWTFSEVATSKRPEHGQDPSNVLDHGYPMGAVNLCGQTPIILVVDGPSTGGFINPYTVPSAALWKLAQSRPGDVYRFTVVTVQEAQAMRRRIDGFCTAESLG
ncbi:MAG: biotin-dependent carboxyltransferase family protein [Alphaproteobacteria bacterium]